METITAKGHNGTVSFDGRGVTITRSGLAAKLTQGSGEKRIPLRHITAVQWKKPGALQNGFIAFTLPGSVETNSKSGRQTYDAVKDENAVIVTKKQAEQFETLRRAIEDALVDL